MMQIIPAIDLIDGQCVRLTRGDYNQKTQYRANPLDIARQYEQAGIKRLHLVDLEGAKAGEMINHFVLEEIAINTSLEIDYSGGLTTTEAVETAFRLGAAMVSIGSMAVKKPALVKQWLKRFGGERIIIGMDVLDGNIRINGWQKKTGLSLVEMIEKYLPSGLRTIICTDIAKDGAMQGPSFELYASLMKQFPTLNIVASGGIRSMDDLDKLQEMKMYGAITGKAVLEGAIRLEELNKWNELVVINYL